MLSTALLLSVLPLVFGRPQTASNPPLPAKGDGDYAGGIYSISLPDLATWIAKNGGMGGGKESPSLMGMFGKKGTPMGSGPYPAQILEDPSIANHTIYAPKVPPPADVKMPFIAWGNGGCGLSSSAYDNMLTNIASHGYVIVADGPRRGGNGQLGALQGGSGGSLAALGELMKGPPPQSKVSDMRNSIDWAMAGKGAKYGNIDVTKIAAAGHSCGGLESYSTSYHDSRVKLLMLFNIAIFQDEKRYLLKEIKAPVAYFVGGPTDMGYINVSCAD
jgi:dienelactone hydrolase